MMVENVHTEVCLNCLGRMCYLASTSRSTNIPLNDRIQSQTDGFSVLLGGLVWAAVFYTSALKVTPI